MEGFNSLEINKIEEDDILEQKEMPIVEIASEKKEASTNDTEKKEASTNDTEIKEASTNDTEIKEASTDDTEEKGEDDDSNNKEKG